MKDNFNQYSQDSSPNSFNMSTNQSDTSTPGSSTQSLTSSAASQNVPTALSESTDIVQLGARSRTEKSPATTRQGYLTELSPGAANQREIKLDPDVTDRKKPASPTVLKNYENTVVVHSCTEGVQLRFEEEGRRRNAVVNGAGTGRALSTIDTVCTDDKDNLDQDLDLKPGKDKRSVTLPRHNTADSVPVVSDNIGRSGVRKIAKLWRFLTKKRPVAAGVSTSLDTACQTEDDLIGCVHAGDRRSIVSSSSSFSSGSPSCFCAGLRLGCGGERKHHSEVETGVTADSRRVSRAVVQECIELGVTSQGEGRAVGTPAVVVDTVGRDRGIYQHFCCGGNVGGDSATSSLISLADLRRDMAPGLGRVTGEASFARVTGEVEGEIPAPPPAREPSPPPPAILPRGSTASSTIHTQIDYVHCLVPDLARIASCSYYWGVMDRYEAERLLDGRPEGTFLLRDSAQFDFLFSVSFRRYGRSLHARVEQWNHRFSFDSHDPSVFSSPSVCHLIEHYKDPASCMFFEPLLTAPLPRNFTFSLQSLCRTAICSSTTYDGIASLPLPQSLRDYLQYYHYKQEVRVRRFEALPVPPIPPSRPGPALQTQQRPAGRGRGENQRASVALGSAETPTS